MSVAKFGIERAAFTEQVSKWKNNKLRAHQSLRVFVATAKRHPGVRYSHPGYTSPNIDGTLLLQQYASTIRRAALSR
jgi:hypothetical protein